MHKRIPWPAALSPLLHQPAARRLVALALLIAPTAIHAQLVVPLRVACPPDQTNWICGVSSTVSVTYPAPTVSGGSCSSGPVVSCSPPSGALFIPGQTTVTCTATNRCGQRATCSFIVTVARDNLPPAIACPANIVRQACDRAGLVVSFPKPSATDNLDPSPAVTCTPASGTRFPTGSTVVVCTATDACTNRSTCTFTVTVNLDTTPPNLTCPTNITVSLCSTCGVSQCLASPPTPIRPASTGNGLFYGAAFEHGLTLNEINQRMILRAADGYHPVHVNAWQPGGQGGTDAARFAAAWVRDDDSAFPYGFNAAATVAQLHAEELAQTPARPISLSGYKISAHESRFAVAYLHDDSDYAWRLILDRDFDQYQAAFETLAAQGFRPIAVSGCSYDGVEPRYSGVFVQDGLPGADWVSAHRIAEADYQAWIDERWAAGFRPISISGYTIGTDTFFTAVLVRRPNSGPYAARHGLTEEGLVAENAAWSNAAINPFEAVLRPTVVAAYGSESQGGARRYAAVWRASAPRGFSATGTTVPSLSGLDDAMKAFLQSREINAASLCVSRNGGIVHHRGYNWAPDEFKATQPCSRFRIASASKPIAAIAVLKLIEANYFVGMKSGGLQALTLDTPYFQIGSMPNLPAAYGSAARNITIRQLLQHRAGWDSELWDPFGHDGTIAAKLGKNLPLTRQDVIDFMMNPALWPTPNASSSVGFPGLFPPGTVSAYSNFGYALLAHLVEVLSRQSFESYVRENILLPVGALFTRVGHTARLLALSSPDEITYTAGLSTHPRWYVSDSSYDPLQAANPTVRSAVGTGEPGAPYPTTPYGANNLQIIDGPGGWVATSDDLVRLLKSFDGYTPGQTDTHTPLLSYDSVWEMWSNPTNQYPFLADTYALGWQEGTLANGVKVQYHRGDIDGALALICRRSDGINFAALFSRNAGNGSFSAINNGIDSITQWPVCPDGVAVSYPAPTATDAGGGSVSVSCVPPSGSVFPIGFHSVNCTATDACGNRSTCSFRVTVKSDHTPPTLDCPTNRVVWTCSTNGAVVNYPTPAAEDDTDPSPAVVCVPRSGSTFPPGRTMVTCTATDDCTNRTTCSFAVTVNVDTTPPVIDCPPDLIAWTCNPNGVAVNFPTPTAFDNHDPSPNVVCVPASGSVFALGQTSVTCTATDACGNRRSCTFAVHVLRDIVPPTIVCPPSGIRYTCQTSGGVVIYTAPEVDDNEDPAPQVVCTPPFGAQVPLGTNVVRCVVTDRCGNSNSCAFTIDMRLDTIPPVISCPDDIIVTTCDPRGVSVDWPKPTIVDNNVSNPQSSCTPSSGSVFPLGQTIVKCEARDSCGNTSRCSFLVRVVPDVNLPRLDADGDGLSDVWQAQFGAQGLRPGDDTDGDGYSNAEEAAMGTNPRSRDGRKVIDCEGYTYLSGGLLGANLVLTTVPGKLYQIEGTPDLSRPWGNLGEAITGRAGSEIQRLLVRVSNPPATYTNQGFFRAKISDIDADGDGVTAWEESIIGTSDLTPNTHGNPGGDHQAGLDWVAGHPAPARLREVALAHVGGSPEGPTQTALVTATGTGGSFKLSSWTLNPGTLAPIHLQDTAAIDGWNAQLHPLEPPVSPTLTLNPFVNGRLREDGNLWLTTRRVNAIGTHSALTTIGYGANASFRVEAYAMAHRPVLSSGAAGQVDHYILITPVIGSTTAGARQLRVVTWSVNPTTGNINGIYDSGDLAHQNLPADGGRLQITRETDTRFVISYLNSQAELSSWFFDIESSGNVLPRSGGTSGVDLRGAEMSPVGTTDFALGPLNSGGFVTLLTGTNCAARLAVWEDRVHVAADTTATGEPYLITDNSFDLNPGAAGVEITPPILPDSWSDSAAADEEFGRAVAVGDFNGDGRADAAVGAPGQNVAKDGAPTADAAGMVSILYGHADGLTNTYPNQTWTQDSPGVVGVADTGDHFGQALATGDFNGDGFADLAIGVPYEDVDGISNAGAVNVLYGSISGLRSDGSQVWYQGAGGLAGSPGQNEFLGYALVAGDLNGDGRDDLAIGVPGDTINGSPAAGAVHVLYGSVTGLSAIAGPGTQYLHQDSASILGVAQAEDSFGQALAAADINGDGRDDLVIGIPHESVDTADSAGAVQIIYGTAIGLGTQNQLIYQGTIEPGMETFPAKSETGDFFGASLAAADFNGDGFADVAIGVPHENIANGDIVDAGVVHILRGGPAGVTTAQHQLLSQVIYEDGDLFGSALAAGDFNGDGVPDLAVGVPHESVINNSVVEAGAVDVYAGGAGGLAWATSFYQGALGNGGYEETAEESDHFGQAISAGDLNGDGRDDLVVGVPREDLVPDDETVYNAGVVHAIYGSAGGLTGQNDQVWSQGEPRRVRALLTDSQREAAGGVRAGKLFERMPAGERTNVHVASVTKCMTLLLAVELLQTPGADVHLDDVVPVSELAAGTGGSHVDLPYGVALAEGDEMPLELLLYGMMLRSCNKSSVAIAEHLARKQYLFMHGPLPDNFDACDYFVTNMMQSKATELAMVDTLFGHPAGGTITPPQDLVNLWRYAWQFPAFQRFSTDTEWIDQGHDADGHPKIWSLEKLSAESGYPGLEGWKGGNGGLWKGTFPFGVPFCTSSVLGQATRLEHTLIFALEQTGNRWGSVRQLLDYGYRLLFTPDHRGSGSIQTPAITDFAVRKIHDTLAVSAVIYGADQLRLDAWQVVAGIGQVGSLQNFTVAIGGLPAGTHLPRTKILDVTSLPTVGEAEADYLTGHLDGGDLRLDVWRLGATP